MLANEKIVACRISEVGNDHFSVLFFDGTTKTVYFEDLPYLETGKNLHEGDIIKVRIDGSLIVPLLSRPRTSSSQVPHLDSRRNKMIEYMDSFDFLPIKKILASQVQKEIIRQEKEHLND